MWASLPAKELEVHKIKEENPDSEYTLPVSSAVQKKTLTETEEDKICYISPGNKFFDVVLSAKLVTQLFVPKIIYSLLPNRRVPVVLRHGAKNWNVTYMGDAPMPRFGCEWGNFVTQNHLKLGDVCVFELMENTQTNIRFKVHLFRIDDLPLELLVPIPGTTLQTPICIDDD